MDAFEPFHPGDVFGRSVGGILPRSFIAPQRYIQGPGVYSHFADYVRLLGVRSVAILGSERRLAGNGATIVDSLRRGSIGSVVAVFGGESSLDEIEARSRALSGSGVDAVVALGGGKCIDTGKAVAHRLGVPVVVAPTLASNDAPCSASSILYRADGVYDGIEFYAESPALVIVDTEVIAAAPERFLVAGMGDAMATWYEARVVGANPDGLSAIAGRPTIAAAAIGAACASTLFERGRDAAASVAVGEVSESLEQVVEANTLLSGLGFESGGVAVAHGVGMSFTALDDVHHRFLHGEMVAFGVLAQLALEGLAEEARTVAEFFAAIGLPVRLEHLSVSSQDKAAIEVVASGAVAFPPSANMPFVVTEEGVAAAMIAADDIGRGVVADLGDAAYRRLHDREPT